MDVELRTTPGCPHSGPALELLREVLEPEGMDAEHLTVREVTAENEPEEPRFHGSASFMAEGCDTFPAGSAPALSGRTCHTVNSVAVLPSVES